ncbi:cytochrome b [Crenobacter sp. SG2303]|uniref:Cytochrome b n=1 Tax=Crenobacter oryzisoli TaxID=3056844 RepID=A0ABT7XUM8_9NEIS|nr:cytochrome b [Crenobacter sp. SG2303]MDN0077509.1 cytochrome b [Crenobacter sp. SG2303]
MTTPVLPSSKASLPLRSLHWLMALAIASAWALIYSKGLFAKGTPERSFLSGAHIFAGLTVLTLWLPRALVRFFSPLPDIAPIPPRWQERLARAMHWLLYAGMLLIPVLGILFVQAGGKEIGFLGLTLPTVIGTDKALSHSIKEVHETLGLAMLYLVIAHAGAAIWHHLVQRDNTLRRML